MSPTSGAVNWLGLCTALATLTAGLVAATQTNGQAESGPTLSAGYSVVTPLEPSAETSANVSLGDIDGDGDLDIVLAKGRHWPLANMVLFNDGQAGFERRSVVAETADRTYTAALSDLDGDGDLDLVIGNDRPDPKLVFHNQGEGQFANAGAFGNAEWATRNVTVADLNGDQRPEIIVANRGGPENRSANYICRNSGEGTFPSCDELSNQSATSIAAADLNGDGAVDLVVPHRDGGQSFVYLNDGEGDFGDGLKLGPPEFATRAVATGDLDNDGSTDIILGESSAGGVLVFFGSTTEEVPGTASDAFGDGRAPLQLGAGSGIVYSIAVSDLDTDGDLDIVLGNRQAPGLILRNNGGRTFDTEPFADSTGTIYGLAVGDLDGDGKAEIVAARSGATNAMFALP